MNEKDIVSLRGPDEPELEKKNMFHNCLYLDLKTVN